MSVYVDGIIKWGNKGNWCHMVADTIEELHFMASKIGLKKEWFQEPGKAKTKVPHYDLRPSRRKLAILAGAIDSKEKLVECCRKWKRNGENNQS